MSTTAAEIPADTRAGAPLGNSAAERYNTSRLIHPVTLYIYKEQVPRISTAERNNVVYHRAVEGRPISPCGRRTSYLTGRLKNDPSRRTDEERRISALLRPVRGQYIRRDMTFFVRMAKWVVL